MFKSFNKIYALIIQVVVITFGVIFTSLCCLIVYFFFDNLVWYIPFVFIGVIISIIVGAYLYVILTIPFKMPEKFDVIKNKVALGEYKSINDFQTDVANFLKDFFNFFGANVVGGKFCLKNCEQLILDCNVDFSALNQDSFTRNKKWLRNNKRAFHLPVKLGDRKLGYIILITQGYTLPVFNSVLKDFENYYLDDQLIHLIK